MPLYVKIMHPEDYDEFVRPDMVRFWRGKAVHRRVDGELLIDVGAAGDKRFALREGVKRLASFDVHARVVRRTL